MTLIKRTILVVDDEPVNLELILSLLGSEFNVLYASNGERGIQLTEEHQPDLVIMDWEMPIMNGIDAISKLKASETTADIPVVISTGIMTESNDLKTALEMGAVDFLAKPFNPIEFKARLGSALRLSDSYRQIKKQKSEIEELAKKEKELLKDNLESKTRELSSAAMFDFQKNELLTKLLDEIGRLNSVTNQMYAPEIKKISRDIKSFLDLDKSWTNFKVHFEEVNPGFLEHLIVKFPGLTNNEHKICAYLKIGLNNKEIALLTNVESASVRRALNRLKKKLNLGPEDNLRKFIKHF